MKCAEAFGLAALKRCYGC